MTRYRVTNTIIKTIIVEAESEAEAIEAAGDAVSASWLEVGGAIEAEALDESEELS